MAFHTAYKQVIICIIIHIKYNEFVILNTSCAVFKMEYK